MTFQTKIEIPKPTWQIKPTDSILLLGSCFADEVGSMFLCGGFDAMVNPFGTLYNPASIATHLKRAIGECEPSVLQSSVIRTGAPEVFCDSMGIWHSWLHHSKFSAKTCYELTSHIDSITKDVSTFLRSCDVLIITFGTAIIYRLKENGMLVSNCHKQPDSLFTRERLTPKCIIEEWQSLLQKLHTINPQLRTIFTVSPIRHKRDGYHINNISKGILLQAVDELCTSPTLNTYFPSYEIVLDELRDYRFYAEDMIHPSHLAVSYVWQRFQDTYFNIATRDLVLKANKEYARSHHRQIINPPKP